MPCREFMLTVLALGMWCQHAWAIDFDFRRSAKVVVYDAESDEPIAGAKVVARPVGIFLLGMPKVGTANSGDDGAAKVRIPSLITNWRVTAEGYLTADRYHEGNDKYVFSLYKQPRPRIDIVVPAEYRGPLKVDMRLVSDRIRDQIGQREFTFHASDDGYVSFDASPLLLTTLDDPTLGRRGKEIHAIDANGKRIPDNYRHGVSEIALRWVDMGGDETHRRILYVIGTDKDQDAMWREINHRKPDGHGGFHVTSNWEAFDALFDRHAEANESPPQ